MPANIESHTENDFSILGASLNLASVEAERGRRWLADSGAAYAVCKYISDITDFNPFTAEEANEYAYLTSNNERVTPLGRGNVTLNLQMDDGSVNSFILDCIWNPNAPCNLFPTERAKKDFKIYHDSKNQCLRNLYTDNVVGYTYTEQ
ncbi:Retrovirus-related Pol polyprotein from transposon TNT 1-94, partial [Aspergillus affinis]|uniref:Retrovirus-related Pol polyprotein from transposon TNT 1-94 n=1 Tax=Aspergillus affinis TaxID=1070780 RepID=UPI0022FF281F